MTITKKDLIYLSIIAVLSGILLFTYFGDDKAIKKNDAEYNQLKGEINQLRKAAEESEAKLERVLTQRDSLIDESFKLPEEREINKIIYREKKFSNYVLPLDSSLQYSSKWLSEADTLGW
jgi:type II secretory pathway pseudopilin PulG